VSTSLTAVRPEAIQGCCVAHETATRAARGRALNARTMQCRVELWAQIEAADVYGNGYLSREALVHCGCRGLQAMGYEADAEQILALAEACLLSREEQLELQQWEAVQDTLSGGTSVWRRAVSLGFSVCRFDVDRFSQLVLEQLRRMDVERLLG